MEIEMGATKIRRSVNMTIQWRPVLSLFIFSSYAYCDETFKPSIKLPGIYSVWKGQADDKPTITMEELKKCMSHDIRFQQEYDQFQSETKTINDEINSSEALVKNNQVARKLIEGEAAALKEEQANVTSRSEQINQKKAEFAKTDCQENGRKNCKKSECPDQPIQQGNSDT